MQLAKFSFRCLSLPVVLFVGSLLFVARDWRVALCIDMPPARQTSGSGSVRKGEVPFLWPLVGLSGFTTSGPLASQCDKYSDIYSFVRSNRCQHNQKTTAQKNYHYIWYASLSCRVPGGSASGVGYHCQWCWLLCLPLVVVVVGGAAAAAAVAFAFLLAGALLMLPY